MKPLAILLVLAGIILSFQNCGETARNDVLSQSADLLQSDCEDGSCLQAADFLWMSIREYEPYKIQLVTVNVGHFNVGGQCGTGTFARHSFLWELREGFGQQRVVGQGFADDRCNSGQFIVPIVPNQLALQPDERYTLTMELVGITDTNAEVSNPMPANQGSLDIIFTTDPPN